MGTCYRFFSDLFSPCDIAIAQSQVEFADATIN